MGMTEAQVVGTELEHVRDKVATLFDRDGVFYGMIEKRDVEIMSARDMRIPLELRPGGKFGIYDPDGGDMGRGGGPTYDKAVINTVHFKHAIEWTKKAEWATDSGKKAVINLLRDLLAKSMKEFRRQVDSQCMTAGQGVLGTISNVSNSGGIDTYTLGTDGFGARLVRYGQDINVYNAALSTNRTLGNERTIQFLDLPTKQIQVPQVAGAIATDVLVLSGLSATPPVSLFGIPYHHNNASSGTWLGFNRATTPEIRANRVNANSAALALSFPRLAINKIFDRIGIDTNFNIIAMCHVAQRQAYEELGQLINIITKSPKDEGLDLYFNNNMQMAGAPVKCSMSWDKTRIDFIVQELWGRAEFHPAGFYEDNQGQKMFEGRGSSGGIATWMIFYLVASFNLFVNNPAGCSYIDTLLVPSGY